MVARSLLTGVFAEPVDGKESGRDLPSGSASPLPAASSSSSGIHLPGQPEHAPLSDSGRQYWLSVARIGIQVAEALAYAHAQGTLHRDIKPSNLLLDTQGTVWVTDFGLAKASDSEPENLTRTGDVVGTLRYMAPERFKGKGDARSDLYALGLTLYELLTLRPAFQEPERSRLLMQVMHLEPPRPRKLNPLVPRDLETVVLKAIARDPAHRYQTGSELAEDLRHFVDDKPIRARPVSEAEKLWRWCRRNPALAGLTCAFVLVLILGSVGTSWKWWEAEQQRRQADSEKQKATQAERQTARERDEATRARLAADQAREDSHKVLAGVMLDKGTALAEQGEIGDGLLWMLEGLRVAPANAVELRQLIRTNLAGWMGQAHGLRKVIDQPGQFNRCVFRPDGKRFLTVSSAGVQAWDTSTLQPLPGQLKQPGALCAAFSPDGQWIVVGGSGKDGKGQAQRWNARTGEAIGVPLAHPRLVSAVVFTPDGKQFVTACEGGVRLWETASGALLGDRFQHDNLKVVCLAISPDGKTLATATAVPGDYGEVRLPAAAYLWDLASGQRLGSPLAHPESVTSVSFAPNGKLLTASWDCVVRLWDVKKGVTVGQPMRHPNPVLTACLTPDGRTILTGSRDGQVRCWDVHSGYQLIGTLPLNRGMVKDLALSPDGKLLATVSAPDDAAGSLHVWELARTLSRPAGKGKEAVVKASWVVHETMPWHARQFAAYSPDAGRVLTGGGDGLARLWDTRTGQPVGPPLRNAWKSIHFLACSPDGRYLATASQDPIGLGEARLWDGRTSRLIGILPHINWVAAMAFSPDSKVLVTGGYDWGVHFWNSETGERIGRCLLPGGIVQSIAFSPDGRTLVVGRAHSSSVVAGVVLYSLANRKQIGEVLKGPRSILRFSPDGKYLLGAENHTAQVWDTITWQPAGPPMTEASEINATVFSPDGKQVLTGSTDGTARLWDVATGKPEGAPMLHSQRINVVAFSPDAQGRLILTACADGSALLWDRVSRKPLGPPVLQGQAIMTATFAPDGRSFLTTGMGNWTRSWSVPTQMEGDSDLLALRIQVRTGLEMRAGQTVLRLSPEKWERCRRQLIELEGSAESAYTPGSISDRDFHDARARDAEQDSDTFAIRWHLDRLIAAEAGEAPGRHRADAWLAYARRGRTWTASGAFDRAAADYARALELGSPAEMLCWYQHRAADCLKDRQWPVALWYLDRAVKIAPDDWHLYAYRAVVYANLGKNKEREADLARAVELGADSLFLVQLADECAGRGQWERAAKAYTQASERGPCPLPSRHRHALVCLKTGDRPAYHKLCARLIGEMGAETSLDIANSVAWICALGPNAVADYTRPLDLAERAVRKTRAAKGGILNTLGAVLYRAGRFREAIERLNQGIAVNKGQASTHDWIFLAMAHHRLGEKAEARKYLARVVLPRSPQGLQWDYLELELLSQEAHTLIEGGHTRFSPLAPLGERGSRWRPASGAASTRR